MSAALGATGPVASPWPVVGRDDEVDLLVESVGGASGGTVVVRGAAGVGKTRLLRTTVSSLEHQGRTARWVVGVPSSSMPFGALAQYLPADVIESETPTLVNHAVRTLSAPPSFGRPLVIVDDAHLLDQSSALAISQLLRSAEVDVICSWRSGEATPSLEWVVHDEHSVVVELQPLSLDDVSRLLDEVLGPPVSPAAKDALYERSRGSSLFLRELIEDARSTGALTMGDDGWALGSTWQPGARVMDLVATRIGRRTETEQVVLEALALAEPVALDLLVSISHADALVSLERAQVIEVRADALRADVRFAHPLYGESMRSRLGLAAARQRTRALADALAATGMRRRGDLLTLARWRLEGGGELEADQWATAARQAIALNAPEAEAITRRAVEAGAGTVAWAALGHLRADARDLPGAMEAFDHAAAAATDDNERVLVAVGHARALSWVADQADDAIAVLDEVSERVGPGDARLPLAIHRIAVLVNAGRLTEGLTEIETILALDLPPEPRIETLNLRAVALAFAGRTDEAREAADQLLAETFAISDSHPHLLHLLPSAASPSLVVRLVAGELDATAALLERFRPVARGAEGTGYLAALEGRLALMQGRPQTALDLLRDAQRSLALTMTRARSIWAESLADEAAAHLGLPPEPAIEPELDPGGDLAHRFLVIDAMRARASAEAQRGHLPNARRLLANSIQVSKEGGMLAGEIWAAYEGFRLGGEGFAETLVSLAGRMQGPVGELFPRHAAARLADVPAELEATALALSETGFNLWASGCAAEASRSYRRHGISGGATRCAALAQRLLERCEGAGRAELADLSELADLTPRERDVTLLAAKGLTNREIADTTCTSLRTVEGHLLRAYKKLGVTSRAELMSHFGDT